MVIGFSGILAFRYDIPCGKTWHHAIDIREPQLVRLQHRGIRDPQLTWTGAGRTPINLVASSEAAVTVFDVQQDYGALHYSLNSIRNASRQLLYQQPAHPVDARQLADAAAECGEGPQPKRQRHLPISVRLVQVCDDGVALQQLNACSHGHGFVLAQDLRKLPPLHWHD